MFKRIEELEVYQLSEEMADKIWNICVGWDALAKFTVGKQFVSAADSIGANLSEGHGRYSLKENVRFCYYARGSLDESRHWLRRAYNRKLLTLARLTEITKIIEEFGPKLNAYINSIKRQMKNGE